MMSSPRGSQFTNQCEGPTPPVHQRYDGPPSAGPYSWCPAPFYQGNNGLSSGQPAFNRGPLLPNPPLFEMAPPGMNYQRVGQQQGYQGRMSGRNGKRKGKSSPCTSEHMGNKEGESTSPQIEGRISTGILLKDVEQLAYDLEKTKPDGLMDSVGADQDTVLSGGPASPKSSPISVGAVPASAGVQQKEECLPSAESTSLAECTPLVESISSVDPANEVVASVGNELQREETANKPASAVLNNVAGSGVSKPSPPSRLSCAGGLKRPSAADPKGKSYEDSEKPEKKGRLESSKDYLGVINATYSLVKGLELLFRKNTPLFESFGGCVTELGESTTPEERQDVVKKMLEGKFLEELGKVFQEYLHMFSYLMKDAMRQKISLCCEALESLIGLSQEVLVWEGISVLND